MPRQERVPATDGFPLAATVFEPADAGHARGLVVMSPAMAVPRGFYDAFCAHLADSGFVAVSFDYRGAGESVPAPPGTRTSQWSALDQSGVLAWAAKEHAALPVFVVGHSVGAQLVGMAEGAERLAGVIAIAATAPHWTRYPFPHNLRRWLDWNVSLPVALRLYGKLPKWALGMELPVGVAREWAHWGRARDYLLRDGGAPRRDRYASMRWPLLNVGFADDHAMAPRRAVDALGILYPNAQVERWHVAPADLGMSSIGHVGAFRPGFKDTLWRDVVAWLDARLS